MSSVILRLTSAIYLVSLSPDLTLFPRIYSAMSSIVFQLASIELYLCGFFLAIAGICGLTISLILQRNLTNGYCLLAPKIFLALLLLGSVLVSVQLYCQELTCTQFALSAPSKATRSIQIDHHQSLTRK